MADAQQLETITVTGHRNATTRVVLWDPAPGGGRVVFDVAPALSETAQAQYRELQPSQSPGGFSVYSNSSLRTFSISDAKLLARTQDEAIAKLKIQNLLRGWTKPYFGKGNAQNTSGLPPDVLLLSAYGAGNVVRVPVVLLNYTIDWPTDTDFIYLSRDQSINADDPPMLEASSVPIVSSVQLSLQEVRSMTELNNFDLAKYKQGLLTEWS